MGISERNLHELQMALTWKGWRQTNRRTDGQADKGRETGSGSESPCNRSTQDSDSIDLHVWCI